MPHLNTGHVRVFTFKEGLLSSVAHDLRLTLEKFSIHVDGLTVEAHFDPSSLRVDGPMRGSTLDEGGLSDSQRRDIIGNMRDDVLLTRRHPDVRFQGQAVTTADGWRVEGKLTLLGRTEPIAVSLARREGRVTGRVELVPSRWGIKPYKALLGAIRLQDRVVVELDVPDPTGA